MTFLKFTRDQLTTITVRRVEPGAIHVGGEVFTEDVVLTSEGVMSDDIDVDFDALTEADIERLLTVEPEIVILGTGDSAVFPPRELTFAMARRGVGLEIMDTRAACRTFNILIGEGRRPAAILKIVED